MSRPRRRACARGRRARGRGCRRRGRAVRGPSDVARLAKSWECSTWEVNCLTQIPALEADQPSSIATCTVKTYSLSSWKFDPGRAAVTVTAGRCPLRLTDRPRMVLATLAPSAIMLRSVITRLRLEVLSPITLILSCDIGCPSGVENVRRSTGIGDGSHGTKKILAITSG